MQKPARKSQNQSHRAEGASGIRPPTRAADPLPQAAPPGVPTVQAHGRTSDDASQGPPPLSGQGAWRLPFPGLSLQVAECVLKSGDLLTGACALWDTPVPAVFTAGDADTSTVPGARTRRGPRILSDESAPTAGAAALASSCQASQPGPFLEPVTSIFHS